MGVVKGILIMMGDEKIYKGEFDDFTMKPLELVESDILMNEELWKQAQKLKKVLK